MHNAKGVFAVLGGGERQYRTAESLTKAGYVVRGYGLDRYEGLNRAGSLVEALKGADFVILPLPAFDGAGGVSGCVPALELETLLEALEPGTLVFGGRLQAQAAAFEQAAIRAVDYAAMEEMAAANAIPTAEGALRLAMEHLPITLHGSRCLVIGYGRIGKQLSARLKALGAEVTVAARRAADRAFIRASDLGSDTTGVYTKGLEGYDLIVNTVPAMVLDESQLRQVRKDCFLLDLASSPGGIDREACRRLGIQAEWALSLPEKSAPATAGAIVRDAVLDYLWTPGGAK